MPDCIDPDRRLVSILSKRLGRAIPLLRQRLSNFRIALLLVMVAGGGWFIARTVISLPNPELLRAHVPTILAAWGLGNLFVLLKSLSLQRAARASGIIVGIWPAARMFCEGAVVDLLTWPGKLWSDTYRAAMLPSETQSARISAIVRFRLCSVGATFAMLALALCVVSAHPSGATLRRPLLITGLIVAATLAVALRHREHAGVRMVRSSMPVLGWSLLASASDVIAFSTIAHGLTGLSMLLAGGWYVVIYTAGVFSTVPLSLGVFDVGCWVVLTHLLGVDSASVALAIAAHRAVGPLNTVLLGSLGFLFRGLRPGDQIT